MALKSEQLATLKAAILAETDATLAQYRANGQTTMIAEWYNQLTDTYAWMSSVDARTLYEAMDITKFDNLSSAGKRDAWRLILDFAPADMTRGKQRKAVQDIWGNTDSVAILEAVRRKATKAEVVLGGNTATTNTVSALKLYWEGSLSGDDVARALSV